AISDIMSIIRSFSLGLVCSGIAYDRFTRKLDCNFGVIKSEISKNIENLKKLTERFGRISQKNKMLCQISERKIDPILSAQMSENLSSKKALQNMYPYYWNQSLYSINDAIVNFFEYDYKNGAQKKWEKIKSFRK
ncbi:hypothetical protein MHBO_003884, partial [Bonamia ostreae]